MDGEAHHLCAVGNLRFRRVGLPVRVGDEAGGRIERQAGRHGGHVHRVPGQHVLQAQDGIEQQEMQGVQDDQGADVGFPAHAARGVDTGEPVEAAFHGLHDRAEPGAAAGKNGCHVFAERECRGEYKAQG